MRSSAMHDEKPEPRSTDEERSPCQAEVPDGRIGKEMLRDAEDRNAKEEERELASRGMDGRSAAGVASEAQDKHYRCTCGPSAEEPGMALSDASPE